MKKGNYFFTGIMFIGFATMIFSLGFYRYTQQNYYEYLDIGEKLEADIIKIEESYFKPSSYYLSLPFAFFEYGEIDLIYGKPIIQYNKLNGSQTAFKNKFRVTLPRDLKKYSVFYNPISDRAIANDTFYLRGWLWISSIISLFLLLLGLYTIKI